MEKKENEIFLFRKNFEKKIDKIIKREKNNLELEKSHEILQIDLTLFIATSFIHHL